MDNRPALEELSAQLEDFEQKLNRHCLAIAAELQQEPPLSGDRLPAARQEINRIAREFFQWQPVVSRAGQRPAGTMSREWNEFSRRVGMMRKWLIQWREVQTVIDQQFPSRRRSLFAKRTELPDVAVTQTEISDNFFNIL